MTGASSLASAERHAHIEGLEPLEHRIAGEHHQLVAVDDAVSRITAVGAEPRDLHQSRLSSRMPWTSSSQARTTGRCSCSHRGGRRRGLGLDERHLRPARRARHPHGAVRVRVHRHPRDRAAAPPAAGRGGRRRVPRRRCRAAAATRLIGGKSFGGRVASMVADALGVPGLVCLGYPFHPPEKPEQLRTAHLEHLGTPALICQGTRDPFGTVEQVAGYDLSPTIELHWLDDGDHDFRPRKAISGRTYRREPRGGGGCGGGVRQQNGLARAGLARRLRRRSGGFGRVQSPPAHDRERDRSGADEQHHTADDRDPHRDRRAGGRQRRHLDLDRADVERDARDTRETGAALVVRPGSWTSIAALPVFTAGLSSSGSRVSVGPPLFLRMPSLVSATSNWLVAAEVITPGSKSDVKMLYCAMNRFRRCRVRQNRA